MGIARVRIHEQTYQELFLDILQDHPSLIDGIKRDFETYKQTGHLPSYFGRDVAYTQPYAAYRAGLMHIHLALPPNTFPEKLPQFDRVCRRGRPEGDAALVYAQGELDDNEYCILAILHPDAHAKAREEKIMRYLARLAQEFRDTH